MLKPHRTPFDVDAPLDVARLIEATVLPWTDVAEFVPTPRLMPTKRVAIVPPIV
ncbi:MAG: hypothetical protein IPJ30_25635 [Acidobacteria bacterium]|nr:hypothetical protein [Acidobacteriota bacterium]